MRVAIADDCRLSREGREKILAATPDFAVVGDGLASHAQSRENHADVLLVDSRMTGSIDLCRELSRAGGRPLAILLSAETDESWAVMALEAGARGILARDACVDELVKAIHLIDAGQIWAPNRVVTRMAEELVALTAADRHKRIELTQRLTPREQEVLRRAAEGLSNKEIADRLATSQATIKVHLTHIFQKLGIRDRVQLAAQYHGASVASATLRRKWPA